MSNFNKGEVVQHALTGRYGRVDAPGFVGEDYLIRLPQKSDAVYLQPENQLAVVTDLIISDDHKSLFYEVQSPPFPEKTIRRSEDVRPAGDRAETLRRSKAVAYGTAAHKGRNRRSYREDCIYAAYLTLCDVDGVEPQEW